MANQHQSAHPLLQKTDWNSEDLSQILQKKWSKNLKNVTAAQFLVLKDSTSSYNELEQIIRKLVPSSDVSKWSNIYRLANKQVSKENYSFIVIEEVNDNFGFIGPKCSESGISFNDFVTPRKPRASEITVDMFLEICYFKKKSQNTWDDVVVWTKNLTDTTFSADEIRKKFEVLKNKRKLLSKNKKEHELSEFLTSHFLHHVQKQKRNQNSKVRNNSDTLFLKISSENKQLNNNNRILTEIVRDQRNEILNLNNTKRKTGNETQTLKKKCKKLKELMMKNEQLSFERNELKRSLKGVKKENYYKRLKRKEKKYQQLENKVHAMVENERILKNKLENIQKKQRKSEVNRIRKQKLNEVNYLKRKCDNLQVKYSEVSLQAKDLTLQNKQLEQTIDNLECQLKDRVNIVDIHDGQKYTDDLRKCVMQLQSLDLPCNKIGTVMDTVSSNIFHTDLNKIPSRSTIQNILDEGHFLARKQIAAEISEFDNWDLFVDGTSRDGRKILDAGVHLSDNRTLSLGFKTIAREDSETVTNTVKTFLSDTTAAYAHEAEPQDTIMSKMLTKLSSLLSDRSSVMKKYNELFDEWRTMLLADNLPEENISNLNFIYCSAHVLLGFHTAADKSLKEGTCNESSDESLTVRTIRTICELFGPRGDEKNGRRQDWLAYMNVCEKESKIPSYRGNRFNNLFAGAVAISLHADDLQTFITDYTENPNSKLKFALNSLQNQTVLNEIRSLAILSSVLTEPFWSIVNSTDISHFDLWKYFRPMQSSLKLWSKDADDLIDRELAPLFPDFPHEKRDSLYELSDENKLLCKAILKKLCTNILTVFNRQLSDHLDGGYISSLTETELKRSKHSKSTNLSAEHFFGDLDHSIRRKRNASVRHHSGIVMLKRNKTVKWIRKNDVEEQRKLIKDARKNARKLRKDEQKNESDVKNKRKELILALRQKKREKERKTALEKEKLIREIEQMGGLCINKKELRNLLSKQNTNMKKLYVLKKQLMYHKKVLNTKVNDRTLYSLSYKGKACNVATLQRNLLDVVKNVPEC